MAVSPATAADLVYQIFDLQRAVRCAASSSLRGHEPGVALQGVLRFVGAGETRATRLAERLGVSPPVLSRHIADLEDHGYVTRRPDPEDGRAQLVGLSNAGRLKLQEIEEQRTAALQGYLQDWSQDDAEQTAETIRKLAESLTTSTRAMAAGSTIITTHA
ncbi:MarR family transcriptional regulator [Pseudarthrobacter sp. PS3-L1]|uniref:MarR family winged helix-turn-helix transcriptional regulator n=1 Tax=Pseudarthrobacter sp. PS3-L1 TaxID=3046207 RepID=UPI0024BBE83F|nr:MarR family transcriptional regulator [Pseudarthrobacter sp. PS3-L1]MDJ0319426.1 MarR family transcriptional regulator [Pseudarthrobacter sp. PS3-L1]